MHACLEAASLTCHLRFWQNDRDLLRAIAVTSESFTPREDCRVCLSIKEAALGNTPRAARPVPLTRSVKQSVVTEGDNVSPAMPKLTPQ